MTHSFIHLQLALPPISNATTGEDGLIYLLIQLYRHEPIDTDTLIAQGLIQVCLNEKERKRVNNCDRADIGVWVLIDLWVRKKKEKMEQLTV